MILVAAVPLAFLLYLLLRMYHTDEIARTRNSLEQWEAHQAKTKPTSNMQRAPRTSGEQAVRKPAP